MSNETKDFEKTLPTMSFDPFGDVTDAPLTSVSLENNNAQKPSIFDERSLTLEEQQKIKEWADRIEITDTNMVMMYGTSAQKKMAEFSETTLNSVKTKDLGEVGKMLGNMVSELKSFDIEAEDKGFLGLFKKNTNKLAAMKAKYTDIETNVNKICEVLEGHQRLLLKDVAMLDKMYEVNKTYFKDLSMCILAGRKKLEQVKNENLPALVQKSQMSGLPEDAQAANDYANMCNRFEKKIHDLELTRMISIQMAPQIRLVQNNDAMMIEKIQSSLVNTIPLWKSQMVLALGIAHSGQAAKAQRGVTDLTNDLLRKNAETLKMGTIEAAKESERGIVDIETLKNTNESLIATFDAVLNIQAEGRKKREEAEIELRQIENALKVKLLEISNQK
ncbi:MAG: toxic anion resistance protein [Eubacteriaceae bacterium]